MCRTTRGRAAGLLGVALAGVTGLAALAVGGGAAQAATGPRPAAVRPVPAAGTADGWTKVWGDSFDGSGRLSSQWLYRTGTSVPGGPAQFGTGEVEVNTDSTANVFQAGGLLHVRALRDASGGWTSGRVESARDDFAPPTGGTLAVEARLRLPDLTGAAAAGYWPAFWLLGAPYRANPWSWPGIGEIDVMENVQGLNTQWGTFHCDVAPGGACGEFDGIGASTPGGTPSLQAAMHTYRVEWDRSTSPEQVRWYLDGRLFHTVSADRLPQAVRTAAFGHGYYVILNLAMGGAFPAKLGGGPDAGTVSGGELLVDDVAVWTRPGSTATPTPTPPPPPTPTPTATPTATPTPTQTTPGGVTVHQAEAWSAQSGTRLEACRDAGGGRDVGSVHTGDWLRYDRVDLGAGGLKTLVVRAASGAAPGVSGLVQVRVDSRTGPVVGDFAVASTGGWQSWRSVPAELHVPAGVHTVWLTMLSGQSRAFVNLNWFTIS